MFAKPSYYDGMNGGSLGGDVSEDAIQVRFADEHSTRLGALVARDDAPALEHVDQAACPRVADSEAPLEKRDRGGLRLDDDLDRPVEQRILVRVEVAVEFLRLGCL